MGGSLSGRHMRWRQARVPRFDAPSYIGSDGDDRKRDSPSHMQMTASPEPKPYVLPQHHGIKIRAFFVSMEGWGTVAGCSLFMSIIVMLTLLSAAEGHRLFDYFALCVHMIFLAGSIGIVVHILKEIACHEREDAHFELLQRELTLDTQGIDCPVTCTQHVMRKALLADTTPVPQYSAMLVPLLARFTLGMRAMLMFQVLGCVSALLYSISNGTLGFYVCGIVMYSFACTACAITVWREKRAWDAFRDDQEMLARDTRSVATEDEDIAQYDNDGGRGALLNSGASAV